MHSFRCNDSSGHVHVQTDNLNMQLTFSQCQSHGIRKIKNVSRNRSVVKQKRNKCLCSSLCHCQDERKMNWMNCEAHKRKYCLVYSYCTQLWLWLWLSVGVFSQQIFFLIVRNLSLHFAINIINTFAFDCVRQLMFVYFYFNHILSVRFGRFFSFL